MKLLLEIGVRKQNPAFIPLAKRVSMYIGRTSPETTIKTLVTELSSLTTGDSNNNSTSKDNYSWKSSMSENNNPYQNTDSFGSASGKMNGYILILFNHYILLYKILPHRLINVIFPFFPLLLLSGILNLLLLSQY